MNTTLWNRLAGALNYAPSEQPVGSTAKVENKANSEEKMDAKKERTAIATGVKMKQKGNPNKSYSVAAIDKARAKIG